MNEFHVKGETTNTFHLHQSIRIRHTLNHYICISIISTINTMSRSNSERRAFTVVVTSVRITN